MRVSKKLLLPMGAMPALKGLRGSKVRDTEEVTSTTISLKRGKDSCVVHIVGGNAEDVNGAEDILKTAVVHFDASLATRRSCEMFPPGINEAMSDSKTFFFESFIRKETP